MALHRKPRRTKVEIEHMRERDAARAKRQREYDELLTAEFDYVLKQQRLRDKRAKQQQVQQRVGGIYEYDDKVGF